MVFMTLFQGFLKCNEKHLEQNESLTYHQSYCYLWSRPCIFLTPVITPFLTIIIKALYSSRSSGTQCNKPDSHSGVCCFFLVVWSYAVKTNPENMYFLNQFDYFKLISKKIFHVISPFVLRPSQQYLKQEKLLRRI